MRRKIVYCVLCFMAAVIFPPANAAPLAMKEVAQGVYLHQGEHRDFDDADYDGDIANIGFVVGTASVAVIDTGGSYDTGVALKQAIEKVTRLPVRYVINTHVHPDHILGNAAFTGNGVSFVGHAQLAAAMYESQDAYLRDAPKRADGQKNTIVLPTIKVSAPLALDLGGRRLLLKSWPPAHTTTDLTVFDEQTKTLWTGDLLFTERTPSVDGNVQGWVKVIDTLKQQPAAQLVPGHGSMPENQQSAWDAERRYLLRLRSDVRKAIDEGQQMSEAMQHAAADEKNKWQLFDVVNPRNVNLLFPKMEWE